MRTRSPMVHGLVKHIVKLFLWCTIAALIIKKERGLLSGVSQLSRLRRVRATAGHTRTTFKYARSSGRWFWDLNSPGWPSRSFASFIETAVRVASREGAERGLQSVVLGITRRCTFACEHCYEADARNAPDKLPLESLKRIVTMAHEQGVSQIQFSGGEPLVRLGDLCELMRHGGADIDYWILTSGHGLTPESAHALRCAGLTGACVSCDHWSPAAHSAFRGKPEAFAVAMAACRNVREAGLMLCLTVCATRSFVDETNLARYADLARTCGAGFIQVLEPRAVGGFARRDVALSAGDIEMLDRFYERMNFDPRYADYPAVCYHGYHQRRVGCFGAGRRYLYIDPSGDVHACPFCQGSVGNCMAEPLDVLSLRLRERRCHAFLEQKPGQAAAA